MIRIRQGRVTQVLSSSSTVSEVLVSLEGKEAKAVNYTLMTGDIKEGDTVLLNTTAVHKGLGTGGRHFIMANLSSEHNDAEELGHIMKLRYTPEQVKCLSVEEEDSPYHDIIKNCSSIGGMPVIVSTLHSMLPVICAGIRVVNPKFKVAYIMTDGAALPIWFSRLVAQLKEKEWLNTTITVGNAFGGDLEAVNIYTGLLAAKAVVNADIAIVGMGPGIVGTGTPFGFTGVEQGEIINAVNVLKGQAVAVPRISFSDKRERHQGISHHSLTALGKIALTTASLILPELEPHKMTVVKKQISDSGLGEKHKIKVVDGSPAIELVRQEGINVTTMGRNIDQDMEFFQASGAAGIAGGKIAHNETF